MFSTTLTLFLSVSVAVAAEKLEAVNLPLATSPPPTSSGPVASDFQSFSIETSSWADYAGNKSHPNRLSDVLFANLREFNNDVPQVIRIGGNTQDHVTYIADQTEGIINYWDPDYNSDQPRNSSVGPAFWESYNTLSGTQYIVGLNFYKNDSSHLSNLEHLTQQSLESIPADRLHLFEIGNENDYGARSGFRPTNWTLEEYVEEWVSRTRYIQTSDETLRFMAPSFCCFNISTSHSFFSPWTVWNDTFDYDRDGWIEEIAQHGYIDSTDNNPTLQGTLMNHTNLLEQTQPHVDLNIFHRANGRKYTIAETNSISGQGSHGVSDVLGSAMFLVDYCLYMASQGVSRMHLHQGTSYRYAAWLPIAVNGTGPLVKPPYYGHVFIAKFLGSSSSTRINHVNLESDYYSAYAAYDSENLSRLAILNLHAWDPSANNTNRDISELSEADSRPTTTFNLGTLNGVTNATVELLTAPGATFGKNITIAGMSYDYDKAQGEGVQVGERIVQTLKPGTNEEFRVEVGASEAAIITFHSY